ncbi:MAG: ABC transporter ATP-binding protein [Lachnospiraceae bacterium]|nr:ABC transporter ATP-binding protein [Lachnospiraceae bacterium]
MNNYVIELNDLSIGYGQTPVVNDIDLCISRGSIVSLIGANGSGKSTLLKTLIKELAPLKGTVLIDGFSLEGYSQKELSKKIAILMTGRFRSGFLTCREIVEYGRYPYTDIFGKLSDEDERAVRRAMEMLGIDSFSEKLFSTLSDGQKQLTMLARAVCQEPELLIMDEPTSFLDINYKLELLRIVKELSGKGVTVIMSLHELELAREISDIAVCIQDGYVKKTGAPEDIFTEEVIGEAFHVKDFGILKKSLFG